MHNIVEKHFSIAPVRSRCGSQVLYIYYRNLILTISNHSNGRNMLANLSAFWMLEMSVSAMLIWNLELTSRGRPDSGWIQNLKEKLYV
jgi:hypothetical protein